MSLKVNQTKTKLLAMFEQHLNLSDIGSNDAEREQKVLSRCLAALAIYSQSGCTEIEAAKAVWDGADDNGIDAAYFDQSDSTVIFVQAKWIKKGAGEPEAKDIGAFTKGVRDAVECEDSGFHPRLHGPLNDINLRLNTPGTKVHVVLVTTGASTLARHGTSVLNRLLDELNGDDPDKIASCEILGLNEVFTALVNDPAQGNVTVDATLFDWAYISNPYPAYVGLVDGLQLKGWWTKHGKRIVAGNIRHSLGATDVNNEIVKTASTTPDRFWYYNNGITLVAEEALKAPGGAAARTAGAFAFKKATIVNGAQTVSSLARVVDDTSLGHVKVSIRIILLKTAPAGFENEVTRTNNLQNRIELRDFVSQDPEQKRLREEMAIEGIDYQVVRTEETISSPTSCDLTEVTTALACAMGDSSLAVQLKTGIGRFYADLKKAPYRTVFNPNVNGAHAFNAVVAHRHIETWIERKKKALPKRSGPEWGVLVHGNRILASACFSKFGTANLMRPITEFGKSDYQAKLDKFCEVVHSKMVKRIAANYAGRVLAVLFKNPTASKDVFDDATRP